MSEKDKKKKLFEKNLKKHVKKLQKDWNILFAHHKLSKNVLFLDEMAKDIQDLYEDSLEMKGTEPIACMVHHFMTAPLGPKNLHKAAISFEYQDPLKSDLCHLMCDFIQHPDKEANKEVLSLFWTILESL